MSAPKRIYHVVDQNWVDIFNFEKHELRDIIDKLTFIRPNYQAEKAGVAVVEKFYKIVNNAGSKNIRIQYGFMKAFMKKYPGEVRNQKPLIQFEKSYIDNFIKSLNLPYEVHSFQMNSIYDSLVNGYNRNVNLLATSAGKSLIIFINTFILWKHNKSVFILVPRLSLLDQMYNDFADYLKNYENREEADKFLSDIQLIDGTIEDRNLMKYPINIQVFKGLSKTYNLSKIDALIVDESHKAKSGLYLEAYFKMSECAFRLGFTGSKPRKLEDKLRIVGAIGPFREYVNAKQMIDDGKATPVSIKAVFIKYDQEFRRMIFNKVNKAKGVKKFHTENEIIRENTFRKIKLSQYIHKIAKDENAFVLANNVEYNIELLKLYCAVADIEFDETLDKYRDVNEDNVYLINAQTKKPNREKIRQHIKDSNKPYTVFGTTIIMEAGINVPSLKNIILAQSNKADEMIIQIIGRLIRLFEGKHKVVLHDIVDEAEYNNTQNYFLQHFMHRIGIYKKEGHKIEAEEVWEYEDLDGLNKENMVGGLDDW